MTKFIYKFKKLSFCPICGLFSLFLAKNITQCSSALHNFIWVSTKMPKFQKNQWSNSKKMSGQMEGWIARSTGDSASLESSKLCMVTRIICLLVRYTYIFRKIFQKSDYIYYHNVFTINMYYHFVINKFYF